MAHVAEHKKKIVEDFTRLINEYPIIGAINMENLPTMQLQKMVQKLRDKVVMRMAKRRLMKIAIENAKERKKGIENLEEHLNGMPALIFTKEDPFKLFKTISKSKSKAPAKPGQVAPNDIVVEAGPTSFAPGPLIGELGSLGIKTSVQDGKIAIMNKTVVVKQGEKISKEAAGILLRLGIEPMEVGLDLTAVYDNGEIFTKDVLAVDEDEYINNIIEGARLSMNLAFNISYLSKETTRILLAKAYNDSKALALSEKILADAVVEELLAKANSEMLTLKSQIKIDEKKEEKIEEVKEEKKESEEKEIKEEKEDAGEKVEGEKEVKKEGEEEVKEEKAEEKKEETDVKEEVKEETKEEKVKEEKTEEKKLETKEEKKEDKESEVKKE